jgi:hypothetical protein
MGNVDPLVNTEIAIVQYNPQVACADGQLTMTDYFNNNMPNRENLVSIQGNLSQGIHASTGIRIERGSRDNIK